MKKFYFMAFMTVIVCLTGCSITDSISPLGPRANYLKNNKGQLVLDCQEENINLDSHQVNEAINFWQKNNLPKGTSDFVCKDGRAYLPNQVTDCQGHNISQQAGGLQAFKAKNGLSPYEYTNFTCVNGKPQQWHKH